MVAKPARDQKTPGQSHSSGSYPETDMGSAERSDRDGQEPFDLGLTPVALIPARVHEFTICPVVPTFIGRTCYRFIQSVMDTDALAQASSASGRRGDAPLFRFIHRYSAARI